MNEPTHLDLFSGIGGFALAARWAGFNTIGFSETDPYCGQVLGKHWPEVPQYGDIRNINFAIKADLLTGGFPCQPFSVAGKRKGRDDNRYLWPEMFRVISLCRPGWIVAENSPGVLDMAFSEIKSDLESVGYEVGPPLVIPACAVGADHRRSRAWICANLNASGLQGSSQEEIQGQRTLSGQSAGIFEVERSRQCLSEPRMLRSLHGVPCGVDRIKGLGNAIVPQVAYEILKAIREQIT